MMEYRIYHYFLLVVLCIYMLVINLGGYNLDIYTNLFLIEILDDKTAMLAVP